MNYQWRTLSFDQLQTRELYAILQLREDVFVIEQNCIYRDLDKLDQAARHMLCSVDDDLLAYQRCLPPGLSYTESSLGRIVVAAPARGQSLGHELVQRGIRHNLDRWPGADIRINAQAYLEGFYRELGFVSQGEPYDEGGILHIQMLLPATGQL